MGGIIGWIVVGAIGGWGSGYALHRDTAFDLGDVIVGMIGAIVGGMVLGLVGLPPENTIGHLIAAFIGAVIVTVIYGKFMESRRNG
jgi:uncharacterized membrane protein YeaQ/YmgE (transglycosylase-associated protein family)